MRSVLISKSLLLASVALALSALSAAPAEAQVVKPFKISGSGLAPFGLPLPGQDARPHDISGEATQLGRHTGTGSVQTFSAAQVDAGTIAGEFGSGDEGYNFVAANGDVLATDYGRIDRGAAQPGTFSLTILELLGFTEDGQPILLVQADFIAEFVVDPDESTGRFAGTTGSWIMYAYTEPFVLGSSDPINYGWDGQGKLTFVTGK